MRSAHWCLMSTLLVVGLCAAAVTAHADSQDERRVRTGARLFRALLAADMDIERRVGDKGWLDIGILAARTEDADALSRLMVPVDAPDQALVRGYPMRVRRLQTLSDGNPPRRRVSGEPPERQRTRRPHRLESATPSIALFAL